jgi:hypothetical protein
MTADKAHQFTGKIISWRYSRYYWLVIVLLLAAIAISAELWVTRNGPGAAGDSVHYMQGAKNLLAGNGFSRLKGNGLPVPITGFPPGYSIALAGMNLLGVPVFDAGRYLSAILFGLNALLVAVLLYQATKSGLLAILGSWLFIFARNIVLIHAWVMSEPLFIFLALLSILLLILYLQHKKVWLLIFLGLVIAYAALTRYTGLALIPTACLAILLLSDQKAPQRWKAAFLVAAISLAPVVLWFWRNARVSGNLVNRQLIFHPIPKSLVFTLFDELSYWWFAPSLSIPWRLRWSFLALFGLIGLGIYLYALRKKRRDLSAEQVSPLPGITALFAFSFLLVLLLNTTFIDASTDEPSIKRYMIPLVALGILWSLASFSLFGRHGLGRRINLAILLPIALGTSLFYASQSVPFILHPGYSFGYTDARQAWTCEVNLLKALDPQQLMLTNDYELFYFLAGRPAYRITGSYDPYLGRDAVNFEQSIIDASQMLHQGALLATLGDADQFSNEVNALIGDMGLKISAGCSHLRLYSLIASR